MTRCEKEKLEPGGEKDYLILCFKYNYTGFI